MLGGYPLHSVQVLLNPSASLEIVQVLLNSSTSPEIVQHKHEPDLCGAMQNLLVRSQIQAYDVVEVYFERPAVLHFLCPFQLRLFRPFQFEKHPICFR